MLARHPTTGEPIRILRIEPQISANRKTLVWVRAAFTASPKWKRWFPVVSEPAAVVNCGAESLCAVILTPDADLDAWLPLLPTVFTETSECLLIAPSAVVDGLSARGFSCDRTLLWEDLYDSYPYLGEPIKNTDGVEKVVVSLAHVLRIQRIAWSSSVDRETMEFGLKAQVDAWMRGCGGAFKALGAAADDTCIPNTWLIQQFFIHPTAKRAKEIRLCLQKNLACDWIDHVLLLDEQAYTEPPPSTKVTRHVIGHRLTYYDVFKAIESTVPAGDFAIFANSDIYFDDTLRHLWRIALVDQRLFLALLRWEVASEGGVEPTIFGPRADSQDAWILARDSLTFPITEDEFGFPFGKPGCDNAIALSLMRNHCAVANPAYTIRSYHVHASNVRNYNPHDVLYRPHFLYVDPTAIQPCEVVRDLSRYAKAVPVEIAEVRKRRPFGASFPRPLLGVTDLAVQTVCSMLRREGAWVFTPTGANLWTPPPVTPPLYRFTGGTFVTPEGLVSNFNEIFVGKHPAWKAGWETVRQSSLTNTIHVPHLMAIPCAEAWGTSLSAWVLHYLPRALDLRTWVSNAGLPAPEFLIPHLSDVGAFLSDCVWSTGSLTFVPHLKDVQYYSEDVWAVAPEEGLSFVTEEDVALLRGLLPKRTEQTKPRLFQPTAVLCVDDDPDAVCTRKWAEQVAEHILSRGWSVRYVGVKDSPSERRQAFSEATWLIGSGEALDWLWMAPKDTTVMEFMSDSSPVGDHIHLAAAAGLRHIVGVVKREPIEHQRQNALLDIGRALRKHGFRDMLSLLRLPHSSSTAFLKPTVTLPTGVGLAGIWSHAGDTFREMAEIWAERDYVDLKTTEDSGFCWWGDVGEILLYDRPTPRWWTDLPSYQMALFGNCAPPGPDKHLLRQSVWGFWPRSPRAVEDFVARKETLLDYGERKIASLFLGKVENGVQRAHRCAVDWSSAVELFSMPLDSTGAAYPYTQKGYLNKLCSARFGLCLPGFGPKCNREIEYFACGCVPIVVDGVDMKGYLVPPVEGTHYFRARSPEDVKRIVAETSVEAWTAMSAAGREWWSTYCSAEGLFRLTWSRIEQCRPYFNVGIPSSFP